MPTFNIGIVNPSKDNNIDIKGLISSSEENSSLSKRVDKLEELTKLKSYNEIEERIIKYLDEYTSNKLLCMKIEIEKYFKESLKKYEEKLEKINYYL